MLKVLRIRHVHIQSIEGKSVQIPQKRDEKKDKICLYVYRHKMLYLCSFSTCTIVFVVAAYSAVSVLCCFPVVPIIHVLSFLLLLFFALYVHVYDVVKPGRVIFHITWSEFSFVISYIHKKKYISSTSARCCLKNNIYFQCSVRTYTSTAASLLYPKQNPPHTLL